MTYLLDANVFIEAKNRYYGFDICPGFWTWLDSANKAGRVFSIEKVQDELAAGNDDLADWATARGQGFFLPFDAKVGATLGVVSSWITSQGYAQGEVNRFLSGADFYLIAHGLAHGYTVVTHEIPAPGAKRVKIPNVCVGLGVKFMSPFLMLRHEQVRFV